MNESEDLKKVLASLQDLEDEVNATSRNSETVARGTRSISRIVFAILGSFALLNIYFVNDLAQEIKVIIGSMNKMYVHFGNVTERVTAIRQHVQHMGLNVRTMPIIKEQMQEMNDSVVVMTNSVDAMKSNIVVLDQRIGHMNHYVNEMAGRFRHMNKNVGNMGYNVNQMSTTVPGQ